jgi:hypothetical protein
MFVLGDYNICVTYCWSLWSFAFTQPSPIRPELFRSLFSLHTSRWSLTCYKITSCQPNVGTCDYYPDRYSAEPIDPKKTRPYPKQQWTLRKQSQQTNMLPLVQPRRGYLAECFLSVHWVWDFAMSAPLTARQRLPTNTKCYSTSWLLVT